MNKIIAIDGPAGSGKGTLASSLSKELNLVNIDTGATYRCVALKTLRNNISLDEIDKIINKNGQWFIERNCDEITLDGSEYWKI